MSVSEYDAIVVGASFGGLAVARRLHGRVLLLDRNEVGAVQTSACGTPLWVPRVLGVESSVLQVHDRLTVRTPLRDVVSDLSVPARSRTHEDTLLVAEADCEPVEFELDRIADGGRLCVEPKFAPDTRIESSRAVRA